MSLTSVEAMLLNIEEHIFDLKRKHIKMDTHVSTLVADIAALKTDVAALIAALGTRSGGLAADDVAALDAAHTDFTAMHDDATKAVNPASPAVASNPDGSPASPARNPDGSVNFNR